MYETKEKKENIILVIANTGREEEAWESLDELTDLVDTAGGNVVGRVIQNVEHINGATYVGSGKLLEISDMIEKLGADSIVCDDELSPAQYKNLENSLNVKIMDRTLVILDIFAGRAKTAEGKLQVELAQLRYRLSRLAGMKNLTRQGGGIGTRGPGEQKLEVDRRIIRDRISQLKSEIGDLREHRNVIRSKRQQNMIPSVSIVGYTNVGKSTLLNTLTNAGILEEDKLFATLDPTTRNYRLPGGEEILLTDTVGFIRKLPHHLIDAFRSTLEEAGYSDIIIHVVDVSNPAFENNIKVVYETLNNLEIKDKVIITVFNKIDKVDRIPVMRDENAEYRVAASIKNNIGVDGIIEALEAALKNMRVHVDVVLDYSLAGISAEIRKYGHIIKEEYESDGIHIEAEVPKELAGRLDGCS